ASAAASSEKTVHPGASGEPGWPLRLVLQPLHDDAKRVFAFTATALDAHQNFVAEVRVISGYVANEVHVVRLTLTAACLSVHCNAQQTCSDGGCTDAFVEAKDTPFYYPPLDAG